MFFKQSSGVSVIFSSHCNGIQIESDGIRHQFTTEKLNTVANRTRSQMISLSKVYKKSALDFTSSSIPSGEVIE